MIRLLTAALMSVSLVVSLPLAPSAQEMPVPVRLCDLTGDPTKYDKKLITVQARVSIAFEDFTLMSAACRPTDHTQVWLEFAVTGRFFAGAATKNPSGETRYEGYGHLGQFSLLVIQQVADVRLLAAPRKAK